MCSARDACVQRDPARVAAHHLHHHHALVAFGGAVQAVQAFGGKRHGGVKAKGGEGFVQVVVNRLGHAHHAQAFVVQRIGNGERAVATHRHQRINALALEIAQDVIGAVHFFDTAVFLRHRKAERVALVGGAQNGAAQVGNAAHIVAGEGAHPAVRVALGLQDAVEAVADAHTFPSAQGGGQHRGADHRVESGGVAAAGVDRNALDGWGHGRGLLTR